MCVSLCRARAPQPPTATKTARRSASASAAAPANPRGGGGSPHQLVPAVIAEFRVPEFMDSWDVLSRGSCFPVRFNRRTRWLCSRHVTHPHLHVENYYNDAKRGGGQNQGDLSWLREVRDEHIRLRMEWRSISGSHGLECTVGSESDAAVVSSRPHPDLDVAELILSHDEDLLQGKLSERAFLLDANIEEKDCVSLIGHNLCVDESSILLGTMIPNSERGRIELKSGFRMICSTGKTVLQMGMCGGPVLTADSDRPAVVGMIEGILPPKSPSGRSVADAFPQHACILSAEKLNEFLST